MTEYNNDADYSKAGRVKSPDVYYNANGKASTSSNEKERKVLLPPKRGTVSRSVIKKAVLEVMKRRSIS